MRRGFDQDQRRSCAWDRVIRPAASIPLIVPILFQRR
jgi:hypothetical protein